MVAWWAGCGPATAPWGWPPADTAPEPAAEPAHAPVVTLCWTCHPAPAGHYPAWDCGPCHGLARWDDALVHAVRTPHGTVDHLVPTDPSVWVYACADCHPDDLDRYTCAACHAAIDAAEGKAFLPHQGPTLDPVEADAACLDCHPAAEMLRGTTAR